MSKKITIEIDDDLYDFLASKVTDSETIELLAVDYLEEGINIEKTLRQQ
jgi:negative regulator of replication initiation